MSLNTTLTESLPRNRECCYVASEPGQYPERVIASPLSIGSFSRSFILYYEIDGGAHWHLFICAYTHLFGDGLNPEWTRDPDLFDLKRAWFWFFRDLIVLLRYIYAQDWII